MKIFIIKNPPMKNPTKNYLPLHISQFKKAFLDLPFEEKENICKSLKKVGVEINLYENPTPVSVAVVRVNTTQGIKVVIVKRGLSPFAGEYCLPCGYVDKMENAQMAAARELFEETGIDLAVADFTIIDSKISTRNTILLFCLYKHILEENEIDFNFKNEETLELSLGDKSTNYCFKTHNEVIENCDF